MSQCRRMELLSLAPAFSGEEEAAGEVPDPRAPTRVLRLRTRYLRGTDVTFHQLSVEGCCLKKTRTGDRFVTHGMHLGVRGLGEPGPDGRALFVLDGDGQLLAADASACAIGAAEYAAVLDGRDGAAALHVPDVLELLQHSSLVAGGPVRCAGELVTDGRGRLLLLSSRSRRYRSGAAHLVALLAHLERAGLPLAGVTVELEEPGGPRLHDAAAFLAAGGAPVAFAGWY